MARTLEQLDAALAAIETELHPTTQDAGTVSDPAPAAVLVGDTIDPRWYTPMTAEELAAFDAANPMNGLFPPDATGQGGEIAMQRARRGWTDKASGVAPVTRDAAFAENQTIAKMTTYEYAASGYGPITPELACYLNLTNRAGIWRDCTTVDAWVASNQVGGQPSGNTGA